MNNNLLSNIDVSSECYVDVLTEGRGVLSED